MARNNKFHAEERHLKKALLARAEHFLSRRQVERKASEQKVENDDTIFMPS